MYFSYLLYYFNGSFYTVLENYIGFRKPRCISALLASLARNIIMSYPWFSGCATSPLTRTLCCSRSRTCRTTPSHTTGTHPRTRRQQIYTCCVLDSRARSLSILRSFFSRIICVHSRYMMHSETHIACTYVINIFCFVSIMIS